MAAGRMTQWRNAQRQKAGGMVEVATWVPRRSAGLLKDIFARLADPDERGDCYRALVSSWLNRRRVVGSQYKGAAYTAEIDLPYLGPPSYQRPSGGRIFDAHETWVELTPEEASEVSELCKATISEALSAWLAEREMIGVVRDHVGVASDPPFAQSSYHPRPGDRLFRPQTDAEFAANEAEIAQGVVEDALGSNIRTSADAALVKFPGHTGKPSWCRVVHRRFNGGVLFAIVHVANGGTSPTNIMGELTRRLHKQFYPDVPYSEIAWFDVWRLPWHDQGKAQIDRIVFEKVGNGEEARVIWRPADALPPEFLADVQHMAWLD